MTLYEIEQQPERHQPHLSLTKTEVSYPVIKQSGK